MERPAYLSVYFAEVVDWQWWDAGHAGQVHRWLDKNTEWGAEKCCVGQKIYFKHDYEFTIGRAHV